MSQTLLERCCFLAASAAGNPTHYMIEQALAQAELDWRFLTFEVEEDRLTQALDGLDVLGFRGVLLAPEFRGPAAAWVTMLSPRAQRAGALNCLVRQDGKLVGDNTYGAAFVEALGGEDRLAARTLLVIGHGRVARSVAAASCAAGAGHVYLANRDQGEVAPLVEQLTAGDCPAVVESLSIDDNTVQMPADVSIVVFAPDEDDAPRPIIDTAATTEPLTVIDTRLRGSRTGLVKFASQQGATIIDGVDLYARETALALELWTGIPFDRAPLQELAEEFLGV